MRIPAIKRVEVAQEDEKLWKSQRNPVGEEALLDSLIFLTS